MSAFEQSLLPIETPALAQRVMGFAAVAEPATCPLAEIVRSFVPSVLSVAGTPEPMVSPEVNALLLLDVLTEAALIAAEAVAARAG